MHVALLATCKYYYLYPTSFFKIGIYLTHCESKKLQTPPTFGQGFKGRCR